MAALAPHPQGGETTADAKPLLQARGLRKTYADREVLCGVDLTLHPGELVAVLGANGSGKSTLLRCIVGLTDQDDGDLTIGGTEVAGLGGKALAGVRQEVAMVFQQIHLVGRRTVLDNVCAGALGRLPLRRSIAPVLFPREVRAEAMSCLDRVGLADRANDRAGRLSGGQQQRVAIARALCQRASVVLADEPVSALDPAAADHVVSLLRDLAREGYAVAAVLHQPDLGLRYADRIIGMVDGRITLDRPATDVVRTDVDALYAAPAAAPAAEVTA
ncbi:phosphonate ABC transporter [Luteipulveratus mongoliensis]|uniref:Phosphonate ABC transporter n=2 Tax=Luteipulveratus mongoliensis TaxID=571913 RepID=A0A0K1JPR0_9MICO|nr:phosphonate ABC transporter [Luteipulveratus mongoliensis]